MKPLPMTRSFCCFALPCLCFVLYPATVLAVQHDTLDNGLVRAVFENGALVRLDNIALHREIELAGDSAALTVDGQRLVVPGMRLTGTQQANHRITFSYEAGDRQFQVIYELKRDWHFLSKQIRLVLPKEGKCRVDAAEVFAGDLKSPIVREHKTGNSSGAVFLRLDGPASPEKLGLFLALQNPFLKWNRKDGHVSLAYSPDMQWRADYGPFESDRVCLGLYALSGVEFPAHNLGEWAFVPDPARAFDNVPRLDWAETDALTRCVDAFVLVHPQKSLRIHVPWCENDYQIDVATRAGRTEWKRILDQCAAVGIDHTLFTPANSAIAPLKDNADAWGWENCLWLGLGQKIRKGEWNIATDPIPPSIQEMLDYAKAKNVKLVAYAYPTLGWKQNPEWTAWCRGKTGGYVGADTGVRSFQDWFVEQLVAFQKRTGIAGYSFDHWWIAYEPNQEGFRPTSKYAQWYGCRRILEELRRRIPDVVIDGRQQYQWFGPWTWLGGSYPHPTTTDEQPGSFKNFPDLHFSRVSGDRQRWAAWWYRMEQFAPLDIVPGYMTHQTPRNDAQGQCVRDRGFNTRDWDYLGWRYSVISSIGTAPFNNVVDLLPARDETEFTHFCAEDQHWLREWLEWTDKNRAVLKNLRPIIGPPLLGRVDGTAAIARDRGFVFLFNPNYRELNAEFTLDGSIGLGQGDTFLLRELYPRGGRWRGKPHVGPWRFGDRVTLPIKGPEALVLEVVPASEVPRPVLLGARGTARLQGDGLVLESVEGETGRTLDLTVLLPSDRKLVKVGVNGSEIASFTHEGNAVNFPVKFAGARIDHCPQIGNCDGRFKDKVFRAEFTVQQAIFSQLAERRKAWPILYTKEDLLATWRGPDRLLLYIHIADPNNRWPVSMKLNGQPVEVKRAYDNVFPLGASGPSLAFTQTCRNVKPETRYEVEVSLPDGLQPGQFQGLFLENVEAEFTTNIRIDLGIR